VKYFPVNKYEPVTIAELTAQVLENKVSTLSIFNTKSRLWLSTMKSEEIMII
jgi:hypothetical protein